MKVGIVQTNTQNDKTKNLEFVEASIKKLAKQGADLITLPEMFPFLGADEEMISNAEPIDGPTLSRMKKLAGNNGVYIHCGSICEKRDDKIFNTTVVYDRNGEQIAQYSKIHMFDIEIPGGIVYKESEIITPGDKLAIFDCDGVTVGLSICYDMRFPELYRKLSDMGASLILVPAVFTLMTGKDHWEPVLRTRAIENVCYVVSANNWGICPPYFNSYGHSLVINPWGSITNLANDGATTILADLDFDFMNSIREKLPALQHRRRDIFGN